MEEKVKTELEEIIVTEFTEQSADKFRKAVLLHASVGEDLPIIIYINSYGGQVDALNMMIDTLQSVPNKIVTVCIGKAMSCGALLLSCGDERYVSENSRVMVHQVSGFSYGTTSNMNVSLKETNRLNIQLARILAANTKKSLSEIKKLFNTNVDTFFNAKRTIEFGIADKIGNPRLIKTVTYRIE